MLPLPVALFCLFTVPVRWEIMLYLLLQGKWKNHRIKPLEEAGSFKKLRLCTEHRGILMPQPSCSLAGPYTTNIYQAANTFEP